VADPGTDRLVLEVAHAATSTVGCLQVLPLLFAPLEDGTRYVTTLIALIITPLTQFKHKLQLCPHVKRAAPAALWTRHPAALGMQHRVELCASGSVKL